MGPVKLHYFEGRGRSQQSRWMLAASSIVFTNVCLSTRDEFVALCKSGKLTYQQVPMLEDGECCISQSMAIVRHAARAGALYGATADEAARVDEVLDGISDARGPIVSYPFMDATEACGRLQQSIERFFPCFERAIERNGAPPFAVGASLTAADVLLAELVDSTIEALSATFSPSAADSAFEPYPKLRALHAHVLGLPQIQAFRASTNWMPFPAGQIGRDYVKNVRTVLS